MQAKECFAQYAVMPLNSRGDKDVKKIPGRESSNHPDKENARRRSSQQANREIDSYADGDSRSMTMVMSSTMSSRSTASTTETSHWTTANPNRIELISPDGKKKLKLTSWDPAPIIDRRSVQRDYVTHRTAHRTTFDDSKLRELGEQTRKKLVLKEEVRRDSEKQFLKEVIASNRRKRSTTSCHLSFTSTLLSLQSKSDYTECSESKSSSPPLGCSVDAVTKDHLISFQSFLKVSEAYTLAYGSI